MSEKWLEFNTVLTEPSVDMRLTIIPLVIHVTTEAEAEGGILNNFKIHLSYLKGHTYKSIRIQQGEIIFFPPQ